MVAVAWFRMIQDLESCGLTESKCGIISDEKGFKLNPEFVCSGHRHRSDKDNGGQTFSANDILTNDPDPGTGISDVLFGTANIPETGNGV